MTTESEAAGSILAHIRAHLPETGPGLTAGGDDLPDEDLDPDAIRWAPGAHDGVGTYHFGGGPDTDRVNVLFAAIKACLSRWTGARHIARLEDLLADGDLVSVIDPLLTRIREAGLRADRLHALGVRLASQSTRREPVKLGLALLGLFPVTHHRDLLLTLGRHEEFTLFAAVALANGQEDPVDDLWRLARDVTGWGRIHLVERLEGHVAERPRAEVVDWIVRDGFRNDVMNEYLAHTAATLGDLAGRLDSDVDDEFLISAGDLLTALLVGGPGRDITDYPDGARATQAYLRHLNDRSGDLRHLLVVDQIHRWVAQPPSEAGWPDGWTPQLREQVAADCRGVLDDLRWPDLARAGLAGTELEFWVAQQACRILGISTLEANLRRLRADPLDFGGWYHVIEQADEDTIDAVLAQAAADLPLAAIATGPSTATGIGPDYRPHMALDALLQGLAAWPGRGWPLLHAGLNSPAIRNRNLTVEALAAWTPTTWTPEITAAMQQAADLEPQADVAERMRRALAGLPLDTDDAEEPEDAL